MTTSQATAPFTKIASKDLPPDQRFKNDAKPPQKIFQPITSRGLLRLTISPKPASMFLPLPLLKKSFSEAA